MSKYPPFTLSQLEIVQVCAIECKLQQSGEESVYCMVNAWNWAMRHDYRTICVDDVLMVGGMVEPLKNARGFRQVGVSVGWNVKGPWQEVPRQIVQLCEDGQGALTPEEWFREYEEIHPFVDGNGRSGLILFNWLKETLDEPVWAPNFWDDWRRTEGHGA